MEKKSNKFSTYNRCVYIKTSYININSLVENQLLYDEKVYVYYIRINNGQNTSTIII